MMSRQKCSVFDLFIFYFFYVHTMDVKHENVFLGKML